jgi:hypothetical protein
VAGESIKSNAPVILVMSFTNTSKNQTVRLDLVPPYEVDPLYTFVVATPSGKDLSAQGNGMGVTALRNHALAPKEQKEDEFNLSRICKFDEIGAYTVTVRRILEWPDLTDRTKHGFTVVSNPLTITIVPGK